MFPDPDLFAVHNGVSRTVYWLSHYLFAVITLLPGFMLQSFFLFIMPQAVKGDSYFFFAEGSAMVFFFTPLCTLSSTFLVAAFLALVIDNQETLEKVYSRTPYFVACMIPILIVFADMMFPGRYSFYHKRKSPLPINIETETSVAGFVYTNQPCLAVRH